MTSTTAQIAKFEQWRDDFRKHGYKIDAEKARLLEACIGALEDFQSGHARMSTYDLLFAASVKARGGSHA